MSPPNPCRACGVSLQHCLEMRDDPIAPDTFCCSTCASGLSKHAGSPNLHETEQERRARHLTPGAHRTHTAVEGTVRTSKTTCQLVPGDRIRTRDGAVRTVRRTTLSEVYRDQWDVELVPSPHGPDYLPSTAEQVWPLDTAPPEVQYAVRNASGEIFPMPSRDYAEFVAGGPQVGIEIVSRTVSPWEVLR